IYFCPTTTFANPTEWQPIGTIEVLNIPGGDFRVSNALIFPQNQIPSPGHYCFIGVIRNPFDPPPDYQIIDSVSEFHDFIQYSNNFAWKNTNVVDDIIPGNTYEMHFNVQGTANNRMRTKLEVDLLDMPEDTEFKISFPEPNTRGVNFVEVKDISKAKKKHGLRSKNLHNRIVNQKGFKTFKIKSRRIAIFERILLKPKEVSKAMIQIKLPVNLKDKQLKFSIKQTVDGIQIGQINYVLNLKLRQLT
ncbi:MAG: hypothetical protein ACW96X_04295, partial [Promethearchaeota archaeon]